MEESSYLVRYAKNITQPSFQIMAIFITAVLALLIGYHAFFDFLSFDKPVTLHPITPNQILEWGGDQPIRIDAGLYIDKFKQFDVPNNKFIVSGVIWFEFNPAHISLETVSRFSFDNGKILEKSDPEIELVPDQDDLFVRYSITFEFRSNLNYKYFPMDDHRLSIILTNKHITPREVTFHSSLSSFIVSKDIFVRGWENVDRDVWIGYTRSKLDMQRAGRVVEHPSVSFTLDFRRSGILILLLIFLPLFVVCFIGLFAFAFDPHEYARRVMTLSSGAITGLLGYRFVIQQLSPPAGGFTLSDHMFLLFLMFSFIIFISSMIFMFVEKMTPALYVLRAVIFLSFHILLLVWWYYLLYVWG